ncbi:MAG: NAD(P)/FAD-dependent oxidoreductase [Bacteroidota bacterium]
MKHVKSLSVGDQEQFDVIIIGGSYSGLAAAMALGRALMHVLVIDSGLPCNRQTPFSHNFLTQDGNTPAEIASIARKQVQAYESVRFFEGIANYGKKTDTGFEIMVSTGQVFRSAKLIFATGIRDIMPDIAGFAACWGISVLHCPYCHGYEVRHEKTGIFNNGEDAYEMAVLISNWTRDLTMFTNGHALLTTEQREQLASRQIGVVEKEFLKITHANGFMTEIVFKDGTSLPMTALYARNPFEQHCSIPVQLGCEMTEEGYLRIDAMQQTTMEGVYACGDNTTRMRSLANAVAMGTMAGVAVSRELIQEFW